MDKTSTELYKASRKAATTIDCNRCRGTGNWDSNGYKVCYKCGGIGTVKRSTAESARLHLDAHTTEVREIIAELETRLAGPVRFGRKQVEADLVARKAQLLELEASAR